MLTFLGIAVSIIIGILLIFYITRIVDKRASYKKNDAIKQSEYSDLEKAQKFSPSSSFKTKLLIVTIFLILFILILSPVLWFWGIKIHAEWRVNHDFIMTPCIIQQKRMDTIYHPGGRRRAPSTQYLAFILVSYTVPPFSLSNWMTPTLYEKDVYDSYQHAQDELDKYNRGMSYYCWYDPANVNIIVLEKNYSYTLSILYLMGSILGCGIIIFFIAYIFTKLQEIKKKQPY